MFRQVAIPSLFFTLILFSCKPLAKLRQPVPITSIRFLDEYQVPGKLMMDSSIVGGLSGIDYNPAENIYYLICDDPSAFGPARFYTADIRIVNDQFDTIMFRSMVPLLDPLGKPYPDIRKDRIHSADVEAMRYNPKSKTLVRSTEGQRVKGPAKHEYQQPELVLMNLQGGYIDTFQLPDNLRIDSLDRGPRHNSVFEGLTFRNNYKQLLLTVEDALYDDGYRAATGDSSAWSRIAVFDVARKKPVAQYAYPLGPVPLTPVPASAFKINGVTDILWLGDENFIIIERAWSTGNLYCQVKIWLADFSQATDVSRHPNLRLPGFTPIRKKLLLDFDTLGRNIYNIEGVTLGPLLGNGHRSLIFVADDNFNDKERGQFLLFEIIP